MPGIMPGIMQPPHGMHGAPGAPGAPAEPGELGALKHGISWHKNQKMWLEKYVGKSWETIDYDTLRLFWSGLFGLRSMEQAVVPLAISGFKWLALGTALHCRRGCALRRSGCSVTTFSIARGTRTSATATRHHHRSGTHHPKLHFPIRLQSTNAVSTETHKTCAIHIYNHN